MSTKSERRSTRPATLLILAAPLLGGCVDYLNHRDSVTLHAGEAQAWNSVAHTVDPSSPAASDTTIHGNGKRTAAVMDRYTAPDAPPAPAPLAVALPLAPAGGAMTE